MDRIYDYFLVTLLIYFNYFLLFIFMIWAMMSHRVKRYNFTINIYIYIYIEFKFVNDFNTLIYIINFIYNEILCDFGFTTMWHIDNIAWWCYMIKLCDDIMIIYDDEMSWGHGDGYIVLRAPMDGLMSRLDPKGWHVTTAACPWVGPNFLKSN